MEDNLSLRDVNSLSNDESQDFSDNLTASLVEEDDDDDSSLDKFEKYDRRGHDYYAKPTVKWLWTFPMSYEKKLQNFDDPIIRVCQKLKGKVWKFISLSITAVVAIEFGIAVPYVLFFIGQDGIATELAYLGLILALVSQIPKRFVWRMRPYMAGRAKLVKKDKTSSFPSRAVTCATVYSFGVIWVYIYVNTLEDNDFVFQWWMPVLFVGAVFLSSFARINLGVHYPSDCVGGLIQGLVVCLIGTALWRTDILGCESCHDDRCYATTNDEEITLKSGVTRINWWLALVTFAFILGVPVISVAKPIDFWSKCDRVYGMLLPGIAFQLLVLCPHSTPQGFALPRPREPTWYSVTLAIAIAAIATIVGNKFGGKRPLLMYVLLFLSMSAALFFWRITSV